MAVNCQDILIKSSSVTCSIADSQVLHYTLAAVAFQTLGVFFTHLVDCDISREVNFDFM